MPDDVKKVEGMIFIVSTRRVADQETGQTVEGSYIHLDRILQMLITLLFDQLGTWYSDERESNTPSFEFLQMGHTWKQAQAAGGKGVGSAVLSGFTPTSVDPPNDKLQNTKTGSHQLASSSGLASWGSEDRIGFAQRANPINGLQRLRESVFLFFVGGGDLMCPEYSISASTMICNVSGVLLVDSDTTFHLPMHSILILHLCKPPAAEFKLK
jgi:hypothetical protein